MHTIETKLYDTFEKNMNYFFQSNPQLYEKLAILNIAIADGSYKENYSLEFIDPYFDVLELSSNQYLYNQDSNKHADTLCSLVNYKKYDSVIEGFYNVPDMLGIQTELFDNKIDLKNDLFATAKIIEYNKSVTSKNDEMKDIFKYVFCGVGLGLHIPKIQEKVNASLLFIMEENLELFRLSLFTTAYYKLADKATLFFSVAYDKENFDEFYEFFTQGYTHNHYIKYSLLREEDMEKIKLIQRSIIRNKHLIHPYAKHLKELLKAPEYLVEKKPFLELAETPIIPSPLQHKPILLIAGGPSLGNNASWLQEHHDKFIIVAVLTTVMTLHKMNIVPDIVTNIDADDSTEVFFHDIDVKDFLKNTLFIFSSVVSSNVIKALPDNEIYFIETLSHLRDSYHIPPAPSVGEVTYGLLLLLGAHTLYLLGLDLALDPLTKADHSEEHFFYRKIQNKKETDDQFTSLKESIFYTKGNLLESVPTTTLYLMSTTAFAMYSKLLLSHKHKVFNLNNGAFLEGAAPLDIKTFIPTFSPLNKEKERQTIQNFLETNSTRGMNLNEVKNFKQQIAEAKRLFELVNHFYKDANTCNFDTYIQDFYPLYKELLGLTHKEVFDINRVFSLYLQTVVGYIFDIFNTKGLKDEELHVKNIHTIYVKQLLKILNIYIITMEVYKEWIEK